MRKFILLPIFASIVLNANSNTFPNENPYEGLSTIEDKQIVGENFVEVYESQNNVENSSFDFFGLLNSNDEQQNTSLCDPVIDDCDVSNDPADPPLFVPINQYEIGLILLGLAIIFKRKFY
ncbi:MAG: hypothetical protein KIG88_02800 [Weeksellaceae bacterium]|nr:hypothetical protein [Weeksellaceae bacterium]